MKKYNVGVVGYGWVASAHIPAINATSLAQVSAVCSARPLNAGELTARHGGAIQVYRKLDQMLADPDIHVVSLCGLPGQHASQIIRSAKAGKHLIIEKPLCLSARELVPIQSTVKQA
ncbi:MAG TPA: Gfo/Idh/MocA family oxidoreductase, partial [Verrucomicrobiae bacterium]|nr:Gfo/Idh/MocA family oxidoreductase [Verrucomicrobiae bacterium]